ncbi:uncharacterized protein LOC103514037 [Diaphorina citri]|uniref:NADH dehydrogenase [ubiquinone] 1 beta subcomplex subunit 4 n=1 Tax=Diaphorina citri TaxID=121845 RepID=A0A1S3D9C2_DIACI|nr:uncharacterized protein LOC103514037 [Diaphorina citri]KAI5701526.1 hypothetical protein M8J75_010574 [Diaphorina citri]KAI5730754.1 hypothetical protein M8J76_017005 [Diaphorina citri]KAI5734929.1 hypothetical protein M8J77_012061 [Diaphorina citri]
MASCDPSNMRELFEKKTKMRMALREEFIKQVYNPHRHATGEGGVLFDPAMQRYMTMSTNRYRYFKPTPKTSWLGLGLILGPIVATMLYIQKTKDDDEHQLRTGQVAYRDRWNKFL